MKNHAAAVRSTVFLAVAVFAIGANAETLLWYRFDESDGAKVENKANPGTMDGTMKSIVWGQGVGNQGNDSAKFPKRGDAFPEGTGIIDPVSGATYSGQVKSLSFTGDQSTAGMVLLTKANATSLLNLTSFTCECFFKIPADAASRTPALFPLLNFGEDQKQGWKFGFFRGTTATLSPWFRGVTKTSAGAKGSEVTVNAANGNKDNYTYDTWHHLALVIDGAGDGSSATAKLILDYTEVQTGTIESYYGFYFNPAGSFPLTIGADMYRNRDNEDTRETFMGDIAEFRISNTALASDELLRPLPAGPVDADTLVYLPMGDSGWFGSSSKSNYKNIYHGILNAAPTAACTPYWYFNESSSVPYPAVASDAIDGNLRDGYLSTTSYSDASSMQFSRALVSSKYQGHVVRIPYEGKGLADDSFTLEWFFKTDGNVSSGDSIYSYTFLYNTFAKIMINQANGKLLTRLVPATGNYQDFNSSDRVDDGEWHHYALVYDKQQSAFSVFLDYRKIASQTYTLATTTTTPFSFGGMGRQEQGFSGMLDDFRITRRALKAGEFLTTREVVSSDVALFAKFEGDYTTGQDAVLAPAGVGGTLGGGSSAPTFVDTNRRIDLDGDGKADYTSTKALSFDGGSVVYPHNSLLESRNFTAEWFAKYDSLESTAMLLRLGMESETGAGTVCWALYATPEDDRLRMAAQTTADGAWTSNIYRGDQNFEFKQGESVADGKWHHWALVAKTNPDASPANTTFSLYRDYEQVGDALVFDGKDNAGGILALPSTGTTLSIGTANKRLKGTIDDLRITPAVLAPADFMHKVPGGLVLTLR